MTHATVCPYKGRPKEPGYACQRRCRGFECRWAEEQRKERADWSRHLAERSAREPGSPTYDAVHQEQRLADDGG